MTNRSGGEFALESSAVSPPDRGFHLGYQPGLDGLRGLAVAAVVAFHAGYGWARGGFLGVSVFFTLSGFLITSLLLAEEEESGGIALRRFWGRRARRLLPPALAGLVLALVVSRSMPNPATTVRGDVLASLLDIANWRFFASGQSYADLFTAPSPVLHYWSLAIEEQLYLVVPLVALVTLRRSRAAFTRIVVMGIAVSWASLVVAGALGQTAFAYYSTLTRSGELFAGAALALVAARVRIPFGGFALVLLVAAVALVDRTDRALYLWGLPVVALLSCAVIVAACREGVVRRVLSAPPLVGLGRISYGVYVYHWPLFLWLSERRTGMTGAPLTALRVAVTLAVAIASYHLFERPIRERRWLAPPLARPFVPAAFSAVLVLTVVLAPGIRPEVDLASARQVVDASAAASLSIVDPPDRSGPLRIAIFGDSTALMTSYGLGAWGERSGRIVNLGGSTELGCGIGRGGSRRTPSGRVGPTLALCDAWADIWPAFLRAHRADVAVIQVGLWDVFDRRLPGDRTWRHIGDPIYDDFLRAEMRAVVDALRAEDVDVVWITTPPVADADPARIALFNDLVRADEDVEVVDLVSYLASLSPDKREALRPDGVHFTQQTSEEVAAWLGPAIIQAVRA